MPVKNNVFTDLVRIEQLRKIESDIPDALSYVSVVDMENETAGDCEYENFIQCLSKRTDNLIRDSGLENTIIKPENQFSHIHWVLMILAVVFGWLAVNQALGESDTLNIYWLLALLLLLNLFSLIFWLIGISFKQQKLVSFVGYLINHITQRAKWLPIFGTKKATVDSLVARAWWEIRFTGKVGKWRFSVLAHQLWLAYLVSGLFVLIVLMMAKQYDFRWGTTLLPDSTLPTLTEYLSKPMVMLGMEMPNSQQISDSRVGAGEQSSDVRSAWARFLIGALLLYGLFLRLVFLAFSRVMLSRTERQFMVDLHLPYYIDLRQRLMERKDSFK